MKKLRLFILFITSFATTNVFSQWVQKTNGLPETWTHGWAIDACDINTAAISISTYPIYYVFLTEDAGETWTDINAPNESAEDISIIDKDHIWIVTPTGKIYSTSDGGNNWTLQFQNEALTTFMNYIEMFDLNNGVAMGDGLSAANDPAVFLKTTDGGANWTSVNNTAFGGVSGDVWRRLDFVSPEIGYFYESGVNPQKLYKTIDGGNNWEMTNFEGGLQLLKFFNQNTGLAFGYRYINNDLENPISTIFRTTDGGENWDSFNASIEGWPDDFEFLPGNPNFIWFATLSGLYYSQDMGETWTEHYLMDDELMGRDIVFTDDNHGWLLCDNGRVYYTENNGGIITDIDENILIEIPSSFQLCQNYPNPFNPETVIGFQLTVNSHAVLKVFDLLGNEVATLVDEYKSPGTYEVKFNGSNLPAARHGLSSGIYFYTLQAGKFSKTKKLVLMK